MEELAELMHAHGVPHEIRKEWVVPNGELPAIRANWYQLDGYGRLDVDVLLERDVLIHECFAGIGDGNTAIRDAMHNFAINSFHVFLAAFWERNESDQVTTETWTVGGSDFIAYVGNFGTRESAGVDAVIPEGLFPAIKSSVESQALTSSWHWVRHYFCDVKGKQTFEALMDNEHFEPGVNRMTSMPWVKSEGFYSVRNFLVLRPADFIAE